MTKFAARFLKDESGATAIEYALIAGGIATLVFAATQTLGNDISTAFGSVGTYMKGKMPQ